MIYTMKIKGIINKGLRLRWVAATVLMLLTTMRLAAQTSQDSWYVGVEGGTAFGYSTFSSAGADKTRVGFDFGVFGGYRLNTALSLELSMKWGRAVLSSRQCCIDAGYWLGSDGVRYDAPVLGMEGWSYKDLRSSVNLQRYGLRLNANILGLFESTKQSRWTASVLPELSLVGTKDNVKNGDRNINRAETWHIGLGCSVMGGYRICDNLSVGIYTGVTFLTGDKMDGIPNHLHHTNYLWESGVRLTYDITCGKEAKK